MKNQFQKFNFFQYRGLPIAAVSLAFLLVFLLVAYYASQQPQTYESSAADKAQRELRLKVPQPTRPKTYEPADKVQSVDQLDKDIDTYLKGNSELNTTDLSDVTF